MIDLLENRALLSAVQVGDTLTITGTSGNDDYQVIVNSQFSGYTYFSPGPFDPFQPFTGVENLVVTTGLGNDVLEVWSYDADFWDAYKPDLEIRMGGGNDYCATVGFGYDSVHGYFDSSIQMGDGIDLASVAGGWLTTLSGNAGDDTLFVKDGSWRASVFGGAGNDWLDGRESLLSRVEFGGGGGDDTIYSSPRHGGAPEYEDYSDGGGEGGEPGYDVLYLYDSSDVDYYVNIDSVYVYGG